MDVLREAVVELRCFLQAHLLDWLAAGATLGVAYGFFGAGVKPTLRYFTPGDPSLSYPDRASTVSGTALYLMVFILPPGVCLVTHAAGQWLAKRPRPLSLVLLDFHHTMLSLVEAYALAALWKVSLNRGVGRLRPFWLSLVASNPSSAELSDGRASYPSGHAAYSHFAGAVACWWLLSALGVFSSSNVCCRFAKLLLAALPVGLATFVAATRIADYKHHGVCCDAALLLPGSRSFFSASDVNAGTFIGIAAGTAAWHLNYQFGVGPRRLGEDAATQDKPETGEEGELRRFAAPAREGS